MAVLLESIDLACRHRDGPTALHPRYATAEIVRELQVEGAFEQQIYTPKTFDHQVKVFHNFSLWDIQILKSGQAMAWTNWPVPTPLLSINQLQRIQL